MLIVISFITIRLLFTGCPRIASTILVASISLLCILETSIGVLQLLGLKESNNDMFVITGSFYNPGPYGGFLSVCTSLLISFIISDFGIVEQREVPEWIKWSFLYISSFSLLLIFFSASRSALLGLGFSLFLLCIHSGYLNTKFQPILRKYWFLFVMGTLIMGVGAYFYKKSSADGRFFMNKINIQTILSNGWKGAGIGSFGGEYGKTQYKYFKKQIDERGKNDLDWTVIDEQERLIADCPSYAFNEYLFVGVEAGPIVMIVFLGIVLLSITISFQRKTIWCYGLTTLAVFASFSYPFHLLEFQLLLSILIAACVSDRGIIPVCDKIVSNRLILQSFVLAIMCSAFVFNYPDYKKHKQIENTWHIVQRWHNSRKYDRIVEKCDSLFSDLKYDSQFLFVYGQALSMTGNYEKSDSILLMGTETSCDPMFWNVLGNNSFKQGKFREAEKCYKHAFCMLPNRLYPLNLLAKLYYEEQDTVRFMEMSNMVKSFIPKVESFQTAQLRDEIEKLTIK